MKKLSVILSEITELPLTTVWLLSSIMEAKGKQALWLQKRPETLTALRQQAIIQSAESSNRIEGVTVPQARLRPLLLEKARPRDRSEEELAGYRKALEWIFEKGTEEPIAPRIALHLHGLAQSGHSGDAGKWKAKDNEIVELLPNGERHIRFVPLKAEAVPAAMHTLCDDFNVAIKKDVAIVPVVIAIYVFEFLCIHPFRDGNGRVSRLLTSLLLEQNGFSLCRYISLERLVEESKDEYYSVLERCSKEWQDGTNEVIPWVNYLLGVIRRGYDDLAKLVENEESIGKADLVKQVILRQPGAFTLAEVQASCPSVSAQLIKKVLSDLKKGGSVVLTGKGRGAKWRVIK